MDAPDICFVMVVFVKCCGIREFSVLSKCVLVLVVFYIWKCRIAEVVCFMESLISFRQKAKIEDYCLKRNSCRGCLVLGDLYE
jgi:hypothetical protein